MNPILHRAKAEPYELLELSILQNDVLLSSKIYLKTFVCAGF
jgi:hypothetical protein